MKAKVFSLLISLFILFSSFTSLNAQEKKIPKYGEDSITCIMNFSLYKEVFKQWKSSQYKNESVKDAIMPWRYVFMNCPASRQSIYLDGVKIMDWRIKNEKDAAIKDKLIDTLMMIYDQRIQYFAKEGYVLGRKGVDLYKLRPEDYEQVYEILKRSVELTGNKSYPDVLVFYMRATKKMIDENKASEDIIFDNYDISSKIIDFNMAKFKDDPKKRSNWENVKGNIDITFEPYATCDALIMIYGKKFKETPEDITLLKKITKILDKKKCVDDQLYFDATLKLYKLEPNPESAYLIGKMFLKQEDYGKSVNYLKEGEKLEDEEDIANSYLLLSEAYSRLKNYPVARSYALKWITLRPDDGHPYLLIGDMYASSAKKCGDNELTKKVAYWAAVDKYYTAKRVDPSVVEIANGRISTYSTYFPQQETIFFYNLNEGDEYTVECWINEKTIVRAARQ
ncbi:MAG: hypothetical protein IMY70_06585 [Bacteroidetes bacterium]|nr:hypothetical protein [Bacteroidota bacterium]